MTSEIIAERPLGEPGQEYMLDVLRHSGGLACRVAPLVSSNVFAPLPLSVSADHLLDFDSGGVSDDDPWQAWLFNDLLNKSEGTFIVQDIWAERSDLLVAEPDYECYFFCEQNVYYFIDLGELVGSSFIKLGRQVSSFQFVCFYTTAKIEKEVLDSKEITIECLSKLVRTVRSVYVSAYDRESYVVWRSA